MAAPPAAVDAHADTLGHVVRAVARSGFAPQALQLALASPDHLHDPELLCLTRGVRGAGAATLFLRAVERRDVARAAEILAACHAPAARAELLESVEGNDDDRLAALQIACSRHGGMVLQDNERVALQLVELLVNTCRYRPRIYPGQLCSRLIKPASAKLEPSFTSVS